MELRESIAESSYYSISRIMKVNRGRFIPWEKQTDKEKKIYYKEADLTLALFKRAGYHLVPELPVVGLYTGVTDHILHPDFKDAEGSMWQSYIPRPILSHFGVDEGKRQWLSILIEKIP